jgi:hypothetical protein
MFEKTFVLVALGVLVAFAACSGGGSTATPAAEPTSTTEPPAQFCPKLDGQFVQTTVALLELDKLTYRQGEPIKMTMRLVNCASEPITRTFPSAQRYDFAAKTEEGEEVWRWSNGMSFADEKGEETYQPSQQLTFTETWDQLDNEGQQVEPGQYQLTADSTGCDESLQDCGPSAALTIQITAP